MTSRLLTPFRYSKSYGALKRRFSPKRLLSRKGKLTRQLAGQLQRQTSSKAVCVNCKGTAFDLVSENERNYLPVSKQICRTCGLLQTAPLPPPEFFETFYNHHYRYFYSSMESQADFEDHFEKQVQKGEMQADFLARHGADACSHVCEIGCSYGGILRAFEERGKTVSGYEIDIAAVRFARSKGLDVTQGMLPEIPLPAGTLVILSHVLEHLVDPVDTLDRIARQLDIGDMVYIEVPGLKRVADGEGYRGNFFRYIHVAHICEFTAATLSSAVSGLPYEVVHSDEHVRFVLRRTAERSKKVIPDHAYAQTRRWVLDCKHPRGAIKRMR